MAEVPPFLWSDSGTFDSPKTYTVPGAGEVQPYTATATYTNASGKAILPALRFRSAEGALLALVFPAGQIANGASSEVTFVPPFGSAASNSQGISFDTYPQEGDWLEIATSGVHKIGFIDRGGLLIDVKGAASDMYENVGRDKDLEIGNDYNLDVGNDVNVTPGHDYFVEAQNKATLKGDSDLNVLSGGGMSIIANGEPVIISALGGTTSATIQLRITSGNYVQILDAFSLTEIMRLVSNGSGTPSIYMPNLPTSSGNLGEVYRSGDFLKIVHL